MDFPPNHSLSGYRGAAAQSTNRGVREMMLRHAALLTEYKGEYTAIREMRKHVCWYTAGYPHSARLRERINEMETMQDLEAVIRG